MEGPGSDNPFCKSRGFLWAREGCSRKDISCDKRELEQKRKRCVIWITSYKLWLFLKHFLCLLSIFDNTQSKACNNWQFDFASSKQEMENKEREREREEINYSSLYEEQMAVGHTVYGKERIFLFCSKLYWIWLGISKNTNYYCWSAKQ